jgi:hypothetical protein
MEPEMYNGTIHPDIWLKKVEAYCIKNNITYATYVLKMIHPSIYLAYKEISKSLKADVSFVVFKNSVKRKLKALKFDPKGGENHIFQFICKFREYCYEAEINDVKEQMKYLLEKFPENSFQYKFITSNLEKIKTSDDLIKIFDESCFEESKIIKYGSCITFRHISTGRYLSSCNIHYETGSEEQLVSIFTQIGFLYPSVN